jgi:CTP-dependent riboflavin kinase
VEEERIFEENAAEALEKARVAQQEAHGKKIAMMHKSTEVQKELAALRENRQELKRIWEAKQATEAEQLRRIEQLECAIVDATEKGKRLDMNIVSSPDRIVSDIEGMRKEAAVMEEKQVSIE